MIAENMSDRLPRPQREALRRQDAPYLKQHLEWEDFRSVSAHVRHMVDLLRNKRSISPCTDAMAHMARLFDHTISHKVPVAAQKRIACKKGCSHCCVQPVAVSALEAFSVIRLIRDKPEIAGAMREAGQRIRQAPKDRRLFHMRCPMLVDQVCGIYEGRPLSCRNFASFNLNDCIVRFVMMGPSNVQFPAEHILVANGCRLILFASLGLIGRRDYLQTFEMKVALSALLDMDADAEARWLAGENVLKDVDTLPASEPLFVWDINRLVAATRPTL
jgi:hypothetical protein